MSDRPLRTAPRAATIRTRHERPALVAAAVRPDNTEEMSTRVERDGTGDGNGPDGPEAPGAVVTRIDRDDTAGLRTTADDYVSNLRVAQRVLTDGDPGTDARDRRGPRESREPREPRDTDDTHDPQP